MEADNTLIHKFSLYNKKYNEITEKSPYMQREIIVIYYMVISKFLGKNKRKIEVSTNLYTKK